MVKQNHRINWTAIFIYMGIATLFSYFFRVHQPDWYANLKLPYSFTAIKSLLGATGIVAGAIIVQTIYPKKRTITVWGPYKLKSLLMLLIPILLFVVIGVKNNSEINSHYLGFVIGLQAVLWVVFEEYGWRGFLQSELRHLKPALKYLIIGVLWYVWHLWFLKYDSNSKISDIIITEFILLSILVISSWGIGQLAELTKSVAVSACAHLLGSLVQFNSLIINNFAANLRWIIFAACLISWSFIVYLMVIESNKRRKLAT
ncbi:type II CAAX prenyl endopeptidase Rce1 family protein [Bacteroidota bacterium]